MQLPVPIEVLNFIYHNKNVLTADNVEALLFAASRFQILPLQDKCVKFVLKQLSPGNSVGLWAIGRSLMCKRLEDTSLDFILYHFDEVVKSEELLKLDFQDLVCLIRHEDLKVQNEETVCRVTLNWVCADGSKR